MKKTFLFLPFTFLLFTCLSFAQTLAPGAPGKDAQWASAGKQGVGTSASLESKVWFTLAQGVMTEVYYPDVTVANVHLLQFVVVNPKTRKVETERDDANHQIKVLRPDSLTFQQINTAKSSEWAITKTYTTDVERDSVLIDVKFEPKNKELNLYVYYDTSLGNSGMGDTSGHVLFRDNYGSMGQKTPVLTSQDKNFASALKTNVGFLGEFELATEGFLGTSDGLMQLKKDGKITNFYSKAENGNVVQVAKIPSVKNSPNFSIVVAFGKNSDEALQNANKSITKGFAKCLVEYEKSWSDYVKTIPKVEPKYQAQFNMAAMILKAHEDKINRGANIASLSVPWGGGDNANENNVGGYHLVWSRDLYQVATAFMALGDKTAAERALDFLFKVQQKADGSFPQNSWLDGKPFWGSLQLDEVAFPLILAYQLGKNDKATYENHIKRAADFLVKNGPKTPQERWEEKSGYSPSTIAAEIAGLVCAADIARKNGDEASATIYLATADDWARNVERWTATTNGKYGDGNYYIRLTENGKPDALEKTVLNNNGGTFIENEIVDAGFLELVRLGIKSPDDPLIAKSLKVVDQVIKVDTPNGEGFYRYNHDGYGEMDDGRRWNWDGKYTGKGRLWALLSGERGQYEIARHSFFNPNEVATQENGTFVIKRKTDFSKGEYLFDLNSAKFRLDAMLAFANDGLMIPEQIWDKAETPKNIDKQFIPELKFGEGTGSATPLAWSMAQFIRLAVNLQNGKNLDTPDVVYNRYVLGQKPEVSSQKSEVKNDECEIAQSYVRNDRLILSTDSINNSNYPVIWGKKDSDASVMRFAYFGSASDVEIVGDFTGWKPCGLKLKAGSRKIIDRKYIGLKFPNTARVEYKLIVDGKWINDPQNPNKIDNGVGGENSVFTMPDYKATSWDQEIKNFRPNLQTVEIDSKVYGEKRNVKVFAPEAVTSNEPLPVLYFQDGNDYATRARAVEQMVNLFQAGKISPFIMVFVDYKDRMKEYWANDDYAKFLATEVVPAIDKKYNTIKTRNGRGVLGASLGGISSVWVAAKYPEMFSRIGGQSASWWIDNERVVKELDKFDASKNKFTFYFDDGTLEGVEDSRKAVEILKKKGFSVVYKESEAGHNWTSWRDRLADAFIALWK